jgi:hypothetical protein
MSSSYATTRPVPNDADDCEILRSRRAAVEQWFDELERRRLRPTDAPDAQLVDGDVVRVDGRVVITRAWLVWGMVENHAQEQRVTCR